MDADVKTEGDDKRLNNLVAITVVILSVFMAVSNIKDDNINQANFRNRRQHRPRPRRPPGGRVRGRHQEV
jgi:hypothetical protein